MKKNDFRYKTVIEKNTFYFYNPEFQDKYEAYITSINQILLVLKSEIESKGLKKEIFEKLLEEKENGLRALLALTGFANESLKRLISVVRVVENKELAKLLYTANWNEKTENDEISEWNDLRIERLIKTNEYFRKGLVNLFFEGSTIPFLAHTLPLFELKKLSISKLQFDIPALIDTIVRYKEKGSYSGKSKNNPETLIAEVLNELEIPYEKGSLTELFEKANIENRTMDFIIPSKKNPQFIIESSFVVTTSSGQGDKAKTEGNIKKLIEKYYSTAKFIGFVDGIGWYVRKGDLARMVSAFDDVFTFHQDELIRFASYIKKVIK